MEKSIMSQTKDDIRQEIYIIILWNAYVYEM